MGTAGQSITLANSIIGVGILAMPFCFQQCGVLLATLILLLMGLVSRLCCYFLLKSALIARRRNFEFLAFHVFGPAGKLAVELGIIGFLMGTCIAYFVVVGDLGPQIISKMFNINQSDILRTSIMVIVSLVCVLPLGLLKNVDSLSNVSAATIGFYFCLVMKVILEAASQLLAGEWQTRMEMWKPSGVLQCVPIFSMALFCQTQLFEIFESLPSLSLEKMNVVTKNAINICTGVYFTLGLFGYIAFCKQEISGNILMSLSPTMASDVIKLGFVMSLAFSFPLIIFPCRASLYSFLYRKVHPSHHDHIINHSIPETTFRCITVAIVAVTLFISLLIPNIELVLGLVGSTIGVMICIVFPAACFVNLTFKDTNERLLAKVVLILGFFVMVLGTYANLQAAENTVDRYDERYLNQERIDKIVEDFFQSKKLDISEDAIIKPIVNEPVPENSAKIGKETIKESEVQPPNPIPPESVSNEKKSFAEVKEDHKLKEINKETIDKVSEAHPKNLNKLVENKISKKTNKGNSNIVEKPKEKDNVTSEQEKVKEEKALRDKLDQIKQQQLMETIKQHGEEQKELMKEQKEILHEIRKTKEELQQKKEADETEAKKIAVESIQKIANVAIQSLSGVTEKPVDQIDIKKTEPLEKIANEAVQEIAKQVVETIKEIEGKKEIASLVGNNNGQQVPNANLANSQINKVGLVQNQLLPANAVNPVQNSNDLPNQKLNAQENLNTVNLNNLNIQPQNQQGNANMNMQLNANAQPVVNPLNINLIPNAAQKAPIVISKQDTNTLNDQKNSAGEVKINNINDQANINQNNNVNKDAPGHISPNQANSINNIPVNNILTNNPNNMLVNPAKNIVNQQVNPNESSSDQKVVDTNNNLQLNQQIENDQMSLNENKQNVEQIHNQVKANVENPKAHNHSPDEPQSYKQGEDTLKIVESNLLKQNVPLAVSMNGNSQIKQSLDINNKIEVQKPHIAENTNVVNSHVAKDIPANNAQANNLNNNPVRQKREVVDCTEKTSLKPEDQEICDSLIHDPKLDKTQELFSKVDFNNVALPKNLPLDPDLIYHMRSLKSYGTTDEER